MLRLLKRGLAALNRCRDRRRRVLCALLALAPHPLPPAPPHARAVPTITELPGLSACWMESGKTFSRFSIGMTAGCILVKHPRGDIPATPVIAIRI